AKGAKVQREESKGAWGLRGGDFALRQQVAVVIRDLPASFGRAGCLGLPLEPQRLVADDAKLCLPVRPEVTPVEARLERGRVQRLERRRSSVRRAAAAGRGRCLREGDR